MKKYIKFSVIARRNKFTSVYEVTEKDCSFSGTRVYDKETIVSVFPELGQESIINGHCPHTINHQQVVNGVVNGGLCEWGDYIYDNSPITKTNKGEYVISCYISGYDTNGQGLVLVGPELKVIKKEKASDDFYRGL